MHQKKTAVPQIDSKLRHNILRVPREIYEATGIVVNGRRVKSLIFTTDLAIIKNCDADAVFAVYPFTPQQSISDAIIRSASVPVFCGVGGGTTQGFRTISLAKDVECQGATGLVLNAPVSNLNLFAVSSAVDIPVVITVTSSETDIQARLNAGASILNIAGGRDTADMIRDIRRDFPDAPIMATGGGTAESVQATVKAGANAIIYTPPSSKSLFSEMMRQYRENPQMTTEFLTKEQAQKLYELRRSDVKSALEKYLGEHGSSAENNS